MRRASLACLQLQHRNRAVNVAAQRQIGAIDTVQFLRIGVDMDQRLAGMVRRDDAIPIGGRFAQSRAQHDQQIGLAHPFHQRRVGAIAQIARIDRAGRRYRILAPECGDQRYARRFAPLFDHANRLGIPIGTADDRDRTLGPGDQVMRRQHILDHHILRGPLDPGRGAPSTRSHNMSSGSARTTGPGRPFIAVA